MRASTSEFVPCKFDYSDEFLALYKDYVLHIDARHNYVTWVMQMFGLVVIVQSLHVIQYSKFS